jgi:hypothetical protein
MLRRIFRARLVEVVAFAQHEDGRWRRRVVGADGHAHLWIEGVVRNRLERRIETLAERRMDWDSPSRFEGQMKVLERSFRVLCHTSNYKRSAGQQRMTIGDAARCSS